jgi:hypothetical protein
VNGAWTEIQDLVFWVMTPCSDVIGYRRFGWPFCFYLQGEVSGAWTEIEVAVFWIVTPCSDVAGYHRFGGPIPSFLIVKRTSYEAPHYAVFSSLPPLPMR